MEYLPMISTKYFSVFTAIFLLSSCSGKNGGPDGNVINNLPLVTGDNVMTLTVNGSTCSTHSYFNKPCVSVSVCAPDSKNCQTIDDILLDTGSYGFRVFKSILNSEIASALPKISAGNGQTLAECMQYADGSSNWGPVATASIVLGHEPAVKVPIQIIDYSFGNVPESCPNPVQNPDDAGYNGILGVGLFVNDCGRSCESAAHNNVYYACGVSGCIDTSVSVANQVKNPIALLPQDNNGLILQLPSVPAGGAAAVNGYLIMGIDTQPNNKATGVKLYQANSDGDIVTTFNGRTYSGFLDSGSNGLFFQPPSGTALPNCNSGANGANIFFCPASTQTFSAVNSGINAASGNPVTFNIGNMLSLMNTGNSAFSEVAGDGGIGGGISFDWGLPFYFGKSIYVGIETARSSLGTGPYWAY
jgi:hypothetical protein